MTTPIYNMTDLWSDASITYSSIKMNVTNNASAAGSKIIDLQVGGIPKFFVDLAVVYVNNQLLVGPIGGNIWNISGSALGSGGVIIQPDGTSSDANVNAIIGGKGTGGVQLLSSGALQAVAVGPVGTTRYIQLTGSVAGNPRVVAGGGGNVEIASLVMTGDPTAPTPTAGDNDTSVATTAFVTSAIRERLTANRSYFVNGTTGSDANDGRTSGTAFATIQKAIDVAVALDPSIFNVNISVAASGAGTYGQFALKSYIGSGAMTITGDPTTPTNCVVQSTSGACITAGAVRGAWTVNGFHLKGTGGAGSNGITANGGSIVTMSNIRFETPAAFHISAATMSNINLTAGISVAGNFNIHIYAETQAYVREAGITVTIVGTPAIAQAWCFALQGATVISNGNTYSGGPATGPRSSTSSLSYVYTGGTGAGGTYFPGNGGNTVATGGVID